ncbi:Homoserine O-succinyltransferase [Pediococcus damnosus]|uniref:Homoserine O-acetyltransferase n=2 Tax=Pediococcus damnosus TaxID=51663 RepID=A0A0R2HKK6_9LACO|nr:homoserine O-succinyltransferase [Pediococcus damnosus]AMV60082.1 Homoserine O-succinyltransferase [Pediococcus damnosus]AMV62622.1 Homoserine O-succinyltransferase [Pediococcus damnosus]AMV64326.1 Homoserine O-succinyltransferase [Pediococcus damnosus]AMV67498.1 Homoserine O-succinyltransferase [Pediococcus damnosus]AMV69148.1 Homoserine O-succinyltransferase [Pediococcus damnosus]
MTANAINGFLNFNQKWQNAAELNNPLSVLVLNLMPTKQATERQFLESFNHMKQDVRFTFAYPESHSFKGTSRTAMASSYLKFSDAAQKDYDALIITGAPVETLNFEQVDYWQEFKQIIGWSHEHVKQTLFECWACQAALKVEFNVKKRDLLEKTFGIYSATQINLKSPLVKGFGVENQLRMPQSRHTNIEQTHGVEVIASNDKIGPMILYAPQINQTYLTGHPEYEADTLKIEYERDLGKKQRIQIPTNYFDDQNRIRYTWKRSSHLIYQNWLNLIHRKN